MPIVIKEIKVSTIVEKKVALSLEVSDRIYARLKEELLEELSGYKIQSDSKRRKKER